MSRYAVAHLDEIDEISDGRCPSRPIRYHFGITSFGINAWTGHQAGDRIINEHDEVERGTGKRSSISSNAAARGSSLTASRVDAPADRWSSSAPASSARRSPRSRDDDHCPWRHAREGIRAPASRSGRHSLPSTQAGEYAEAADRGQELIKAHPEYPAALQRRVLREPCGTSADAIEHLRSRSTCRRFRSLAADDSDFDPTRNDPTFKELVG